MLVKWGSIVVDGSGKLGGHVFSKSRGGNTMRTLGRSKNPQTVRQQFIRAQFTKFSQGWGALEEIERESWYKAESLFSRKNRFGDVVFLSGKNLYNSVNVNRAQIGLGVLKIAPREGLTPLNVVISVQIRLGLEEITVQGSFDETRSYVLLGTPKVSQGRRNVKNAVRRFFVTSGTADGFFLDNAPFLYITYVATFGVPEIGDKIFIGAYSISESGQRSPNSVVLATVVA